MRSSEDTGLVGSSKELAQTYNTRGRVDQYEAVVEYMNIAQNTNTVSWVPMLSQPAWTFHVAVSTPE